MLKRLANPQLWNKYRYVANNPLRKIDPDGRYGEDVHYDLTAVLALAAGFVVRARQLLGLRRNGSTMTLGRTRPHHATC